MRTILYRLKTSFTFDKFPYLSVFSNIFLGYGLGRILMTASDDLGENLWIKAFIIVGTCLFFNYLSCLRKAAKGVTRTTRGKIRPFLREAFLCAGLNGFVLILTLGLFFFKSLYL
jgi:hypothetical protein